MSASEGPNISTDSLILALDAANIKSFKGEPTVNLLSNSSLNGYPTYGNSWGTYNTNQYGNGSYWSIGTTISSVSSNIVNTAAAHPFRSYDVLNPQTSGGGLTAGTNYLVKKISSTSFSLHSYNSSQDGSQGYINPATGNHKVYDDFANDIRISVNITNFPLMWLGGAHLPNSGLVKEIIPGGFSLDGYNKTDCIRLHFIRDDNVVDGMAYGSDANNLTIGVVHTLSFYSRSVTSSAVGKSCSCQIYNYDGYFSTGFVLGELNVWIRNSLIFTPTTSTNGITYWFGPAGPFKYDIANIQYEQKSYASPFVAGTRGATVATGGGWKDLSGNLNNFEISSITSNNLSIIFNGVNSYLLSNIQPNFSNGITLNFFAKINSTSGAWLRFCDFGNGPSGDNILFGRYSSTSQLVFSIYSGSTSTNTYSNVGDIEFDVYRMYSVTANGINYKFYKNGVEIYSESQTILPNTLTRTQNYIGRSNWTGDAYFDGNISITQIYNRALSSIELSQLYNSQRSRFGL